MVTFLTVVYVFVCLFLILVVLLQSGKGGGMGAAFGGGGGSQTVFGGAGAGNFLTRMTAVCALLFMGLSATLAYLSSARRAEAAIEAAVGSAATEPAKPEAAAQKTTGSTEAPAAPMSTSLQDAAAEDADGGGT